MVLFLIIGAGVVAALQIGKGIIAFPAIQADMSLTLVEVSTLLSVFALFGATIAMPAGVLAPRLGAKNAVMLGLGLIGAGNLFGLLAETFPSLLAGRFVEGIGFILIATAAPVLLGRATDSENRSQIFAVWGTYMPVGMGLMILAGLAIDPTEWRILWLANAVLALIWLLAVAAILPKDERKSGAEAPFETVSSLLNGFLRDRRPLLVAASFFFYGNIYFAVVGLFPTFLIERFDISLALIAPLTAAIVFANAGGNLAAGMFLRRGVAFHRLMWVAFLATTALSVTIFLVPDPVGAIVLAAVATGIAGIIPASVMASAALMTRDMSYVGAMIGLFMQGSTLGQFTGPLAFAFLVETLDWKLAGLSLLFVGALGAALAVAAGASRRANARTLP